MSWSKTFLAMLIVLIGIWFVLPAWLSFQTTFVGAFSYRPPWTLEWGLANWKALPWDLLLGPTLNSIIVCSATAFLTVAVCIPAGYAFAKFNFPGKELAFWILLLSMMVPGSLLFLPRYMLIMDMKLIGTHFGMVLPGIFAPATVLLSRQYLRGISDEVLEAARADGASEIQILYHIILPMSLPLLVLVAYGGFALALSDFMWQYLIGRREIVTLVVAVGTFLKGSETWSLGGNILYKSAGGATRAGVETAVSWLVAGPALFLFAIAQKWFVKGVKL